MKMYEFNENFINNIIDFIIKDYFYVVNWC